MKEITEGGVDKLARMYAGGAHAGQNIERGVNHKVTKKACKLLDKGVMWVFETSMGFRDTRRRGVFRQDYQPNNYNC